LIAVLAMISSFVLLPGAAHATTVHCGDTISTDTTLDSDLEGCPGIALIVRGHDLTLDLNGHVVDGHIEMTSNGVNGISLGRGNLVVENGTVLGGVSLGYTADAVIKRMTIRRTGIEFFKGSSGSIDHTLIEDTGVAFTTAHAGEIDITNSRIRHNGVGITGGQGGSPVLINDVLAYNTGAGVSAGTGVALIGCLVAHNGGLGVSAGLSSGSLYARGNRVTDNAAGGFRLGDGSLTDNVIERNGGDGVHAGGDGRVAVSGNRIDHNGGNGVHMGGPDVTVTANRIYANSLRGIYAFAPAGHALTDNTVSANGGDGIYVVNNREVTLEGNSADRNGGDGIHVDHSGGAEINPFWSPDGKRVVFQDSHGTSWDLYVANADGTGLRQLTSGPAQDTKPQFSPDGSRIAFVSDRDGSPGLYLISPDGSGLVKLATINNGLADTEPIAPIDPSFAWSVDGTRIGFGGYSLSSINADGTGLRTLSEAHIVRDPRWTPDGARIVFEAGPWFPTLENTTYLVNADGTGLRNANPAVDFPTGTVGGPDTSGRTVNIDVPINPFATLIGNSTDRNKRLGIDSVPGVVDGGGNHAKHNGDSRQCVNVACSTTGNPKN
jgi:parallel beta-helix repeat protein